MDNFSWSLCLIDFLAQHGIKQFVISPGSRSTPLALAVARTKNIDYKVILDERDAAFFALGQSKKTKTATALICTSGSAVANWLPAVVEANHSATPLILLSADRPAELHNCGANQTIEQHNIFSNQVQASYHSLPPDEVSDYEELKLLVCKMVTDSLQPIPGPVHFNIPFREPLLSEPLAKISPAKQINKKAEPACTLTEFDLDITGLENRAGLILCGAANYSDEFATRLIKLADKLDCPIVTDPLSNLRWGSHVVSKRILTHYDGYLRSEQPDIAASLHWVIQFGNFPISAALGKFVQNCSVEQYITIQHQQLWSDPLSICNNKVVVSPEQFCTDLLEQLPKNNSLPTYNKRFTKLEQQASNWLNTINSEQLCELQVIKWLYNLPSDSILFSSNSMAIRDVDSWLGKRQQPLTLFANRGASGIDGNLATLCGIRAVTKTETPVIALLGDLSLIHNLHALKLATELGKPITILVINNGGGNIFSYLPAGQLPEFEELWLTPQNIDFAKVAELYDISYQKVSNMTDLSKITSIFDHCGVKLVELVIEQEHSKHIHQQYWQEVN